MSDTPTDPREEVKVTWINCPVCDCPDVRRTESKDGDALIFCTNHACRSNGGKSDATNSKLAAEIAELRDWKESAMSAMPPYQEIGEALGLTIGQSVHDKILPGIHALRAELEALKTSKRPFSDKLAGEVIDSQVKRITELETKLSANIVELDELEAKYDELHGIHVERLTKLETAERTLFQTEKRLDDKLRAAMADLEAARKERDEQIEQEQARFQSGIERVYLEYCPDATIDGGGCDSGDPLDFTISELRQAFNHITDKRDTALAAKDAAEKALNRAFWVMEAQAEAEEPIGSAEFWQAEAGKIAAVLPAALTHAPTQEPPAGVMTISNDEPDVFDCNHTDTCGFCRARKSQLEELLNDSSGVEGHAAKPHPGFPTRAATSGPILGLDKPGSSESPSSENQASPAVTISTEKKGGDEPCAPPNQHVERASLSANAKPQSSEDAQSTGASNSPADVPSEGRGECPMCRNTRFIGVSPGVDEPCRVCAFSLSDALAGKPVVTRDGRKVRIIKANDRFVDVWTDRAAFTCWDTGKYSNTSDHPLDLFMLPTEGSGACKHEWKFNLLGNLRRCQKCNVTEPVEPAPPEL